MAIFEVEVPDDHFVTMPLAIPQSKFPLGRVVMTANAEGQLAATAVVEALKRHAAGDWGDLDSHDVEQNEYGLKHGQRLFSAFAEGEKRFWIITEWDRSVTTVLMPEDY